MVELHNITITTKKDGRPLIRNLHLTLQNGDKIAIIGEEGNGKSSLLKLIYEEQMIAEYCTFEGKVLRNECSMGFLSQELSDEEKQMTIADFFAENQWTKELVRAMDDLGIHALYSDKRMGVLSGGERFKYRFLSLLAQKPDVLLLDEPTNDLDIQTMEWLEEFIQQTAIPVIYVSHDETFIANTANGILHMELTKRKQVPKYTFSREPYENYLANRESHLNKQEQIARKQATDHRKQMEKWHDVWNKAEHQHRNVSRSDPRLQKKIKSLKNQRERMEKASETFLEAPSVEEASEFRFDSAVHVPGSKQILEFSLEVLQIANKQLSKQIHLSIKGPEKVAIIGENGIGKTTLLKKIKDELVQYSSLKIGYMPQNYEDRLDSTKTPIEFLERTGNKDAITKAYTHLGSMKFTKEEMYQSIKNLSGGQKAKLLLVKMILDQCEILILDEPTRNFSPLTTPVLCRSLMAFDGVIISISHDRRYLHEVATTVYELTAEGLMKIK
ncbi:ABC-F family ATP-binding cassette domain-containing protein [Brevibacillus sp. HB1.2]|uniref:ATP-binding cassette domain-containing protein n=1 Tax=Brevibacillus sp. HB1.2 TaxID=2738807 RepID=UPI001575AA1E|nr:ATP-binding cassette domain-containing protein [Brevibacillus sp. HB1.2]NTU18917.1 ABC-F family ATP-binding cassette domain-containing protein [Brevibacillus sp. HB1.2]